MLKQLIFFNKTKSLLCSVNHALMVVRFDTNLSEVVIVIFLIIVILRSPLGFFLSDNFLQAISPRAHSKGKQYYDDENHWF